MRTCSNCFFTIQPDDDTRRTKHGRIHADPDLCRLLQSDTYPGAYDTGSYGPRIPLEVTP